MMTLHDLIVVLLVSLVAFLVIRVGSAINGRRRTRRVNHAALREAEEAEREAKVAKIIKKWQDGEL